MHTAMRWGFALLWVGVVAAFAADPTPDDVAKWVEQLGHDDAAVRKEAVRKLWEAGKAAEPALEVATRSKDADVALRAADLLAKFKRGIFPDTPPAVVKLIDAYQAAAGAPLRQKAVRELLEQGHHGARAAAWLVKRETDSDGKAMGAYLAKETATAVGLLIGRGKIPDASELLDVTLPAGAPDLYRHHAALVVLRGKADDRVKQLEAAEKAGDTQAALALAFLYRARGNRPAATQAAERAKLPPDVLRAFAEEQGDWRSLLKTLAEIKQERLGARDTALRAVLHRLNGDEKEAGELAAAVEAIPDVELKGLYVTGRIQAVIDRLTEKGNFADAFDLLAQQLRYREAFKLADKAERTPPEDTFLLACRRSRLHAALGEKDEARKVALAAAAALTEVKNDPRIGSALRAVYQSADKELALEVASKLLDKPGATDNPQFLTGGLFPQALGGPAGMWWEFLRKHKPNEKPAETLTRLWDLLERKQAPRDLADLVDAAANAVAGANEATREGRWQLLAQTGERLGDDTLVRKCLDKAVAVRESGPAMRIMGDWMAKKKEWGEASRWYGRAFEKDRTRAALLYLHGWAMIQAGKEKEGKAVVEQALLLPLADEANRFELGQAMDRQGLKKEAAGQYELITQIGDTRSIYQVNARDPLIHRPLGRSDAPALAAHYEQILLTTLQRNSSFIDPNANFEVPYRMHQHRTCTFALAGKVAEARRELAVCREFAPADAEPVLQVVNAQDRANKRDEADTLYAEALARAEELCKEFPKSPSCHNRVAWLAVRCGRELDRAEQHARKAVELAPKFAGNLDTLGEVLFQRGDKEGALRCLKQCVELDPKNEYYPRQVKRIEAGDRKADLPE